MEDPFTILGVSLSGFNILLPMVEKYQKDRAIRDELLNALGEDVHKYKAAFDDLSQIREDMLMPSIDAFKSCGETSREKVNAVVDSLTQLFTAYGKIINQFIILTEDCKGVAINLAFMNDLMTSNRFTHDYVSQMARMSTGKGTVKIDRDFYTFVRMNEDRVFSKIKNKDVDVIVEKVREYVKLVNHQIKPFLSKSNISRASAIRFIESWKGLSKDVRRIKVSKELLTNFKEYLPQKFTPLGAIFEEIFPKKDADQDRFKGPKKIIHR